MISPPEKHSVTERETPRARLARRAAYGFLVLCGAYVISMVTGFELAAPNARVEVSRGRLNLYTAEDGRWNWTANAKVVLEPLRWNFDGHVYSNWWFVRIPLWSPTAVAGTILGIVWYRAAKEKRPGHCSRCGYPLRGLRRSGGPEPMCPECGHADAESSR